MSSKFFTWTKGDRRNAAETLHSGGVVPIPAECITIHGMDYARNAKGSSKAQRKPLPLSFDQTTEPSSKHSSRTNDSIALHSAAVQSATSLMAVVNDMLRSPHVSAHLSAQQRSAGLAPMHGRPRSHTAPSTPLVEAPSAEPVELQGSLLAGKKSLVSLHQSIDGKGLRTLVHSPPNAYHGATIERPHSSPQESTHDLPSYPRQSSESSSRGASLFPPAQVSPRSKSSSPHKLSQRAGTSMPNPSEDTLVAPDTDTTMSDMKRPSLSILQTWPSKSPSISGSLTTSQAGSTYGVPQLPPASSGTFESRFNQPQQPDSEAALMEHISSMRASHEAHLSSLKEAHEKEIDSHTSYISFLEKRRGMPQLQPQTSKQHLTIDTSHAPLSGSELLSADTSATTLRSFDSLEHQKRASQEAMAEAEALRRKLSLCRKAVAESKEVRRERDHLRDAAERSDRRIIQLKDIVRKAKDHEKTLKNAVTDLEARLVAANNERTDVLEGFHEACVKVQKLTQRERALAFDVEDLRSRLFYTSGRHASDTKLALPERNTSLRPKHTRTTSDVRGLATGNDPMLEQLRELKRLVSTQETKIRQMEQQNSENSSNGSSHVDQKVETKPDRSGRLAALEAPVAELQQKLAAAQADCERYNSLLYNELRRQSRQAAQRLHATTPKVEADAFAEAAEIVRSTLKSTVVATEDADSESAAVHLERELEHCIKEIVLYKLDIKGYKKDLRKAQAQIEGLQAASIQRPPTPDRESAPSVKSDASSDRRQQVPHLGESQGKHTTTSGLGILLPPQTPTRTVAAATSAALLSTTPPMPSGVTSPSRPKTPLGAHKKLPKPPSRTPSPLPGLTPSSSRLQRGETLRSLSESIISSYAKRGTPEQGSGLTPPSRERNSDSLKSVGATPSVGPPMSKFVANPFKAAAKAV